MKDSLSSKELRKLVTGLNVDTKTKVFAPLRSDEKNYFSRLIL